MHEATLPTIEEAKMVICSKCLEKINQLLKTREARADDSLPKELETFPISSTAKSMADKRREHAEALNREEEEKARKEKKHQEVLAELENIKQFLSSVPYSDGVKTRPLNGGVARRPSNNGQNGSPDTAMAAQLKEKGLAPTE